MVSSKFCTKSSKAIFEQRVDFRNLELQVAGLGRLPVVRFGTLGGVKKFGDFFVEGVVEMGREIVGRQCIRHSCLDNQVRYSIAEFPFPVMRYLARELD